VVIYPAACASARVNNRGTPMCVCVGWRRHTAAAGPYTHTHTQSSTSRYTVTSGPVSERRRWRAGRDLCMQVFVTNEMLITAFPKLQHVLLTDSVAVCWYHLLHIHQWDARVLLNMERHRNCYTLQTMRWSMGQCEIRKTAMFKCGFCSHTRWRETVSLFLNIQSKMI